MKINKYIYLVLISGILFQGCIAKKYIQPEVIQQNNSYRGSDSNTENFATAGWEDFYQDPHLKKLIKMALDSNFDVRIAESNIRIAQEYLKQSKAAFYPTLMAGASGGINTTGSATTGVYSLYASTINSGTQASWELDIWGKLRSAKRSQQAQLMQSESYCQAVQTELVASLASAYYSLLAYDAQLEIYKTSAQTRFESINVLEAFKNSAQSNEIAVNQGKAQYFYAEAQIPLLNIKIQATENLISLLLGRAPEPIERGSFANQDTERGEHPNIMADFTQVGVPGQLLVNRPDVLAAEYNLISAFEHWNYTRAAMYPSLVISGSAGYGSPGTFLAELMGGLTAPIFNNRKLKTQRNVAYENQVQAALNFEKCVVNAQREVVDALTAYQFSQQSIGYQNSQVKELNNAVENSMVMLKNGYSTYLDLLYAEDNALSASIVLIEIYLQNAKAKIELYRALGGK
ncbi:efflux transporter outer membrane subunit [Bacteroidales bacterium OttesenSCG-928-B11]|nr:efflux transporter outer membrane subunit [Bacteroidales bacterium OttesenSCG-928-C03]MDL2311423.1 efflux transporter outer membrane subunit [Bacteroidales bacterium OttesenSCG-928-B11]